MAKIRRVADLTRSLLLSSPDGATSERSMPDRAPVQGPMVLVPTQDPGDHEMKSEICTERKVDEKVVSVKLYAERRVVLVDSFVLLPP